MLFNRHSLQRYFKGDLNLLRFLLGSKIYSSDLDRTGDVNFFSLISGCLKSPELPVRTGYR